MAIVGTMGMVGIAVNDSVVVLAALAATDRSRAAIDESVRKSSRHVLTTTITTTAGFIPLLLSGSQFWGPVATVMIGGVNAATLLSLAFVPACFAICFNRD